MAKILVEIPDTQYNNIMSISSLNLGQIPYKGIVMYAINGIKNGTILPDNDTDGTIKVLEQEPFINKACVSTNICKHDKAVALKKLKAEIKKKHTKAKQATSVLQMNAYTDCLQMIDNLLEEAEND